MSLLTNHLSSSMRQKYGRGCEGGCRSGKGVWGMIEDSELAKSIRLNEGKKVCVVLSDAICST